MNNTESRPCGTTMVFFRYFCESVVFKDLTKSKVSKDSFVSLWKYKITIQ